MLSSVTRSCDGGDSPARIWRSVKRMRCPVWLRSEIAAGKSATWSVMLLLASAMMRMRATWGGSEVVKSTDSSPEYGIW